MNIAQAAPRNSRVRISADSAWPLRAPCGRTYAERAARGMSARQSRDRNGLGPKAASPVGNADAPKSRAMDTNRGFLARLFGARK